MSHDEALEALSTAAQGDNPEVAEFEQAPAAPPVVETPQGEQTPAVQPDAPAQPVAEDTEQAFFNPDDVAPELMQGWKQLQAAFTQKTQQLAEERRQLEQYGDLEQVEQAVELYTRLSDPDNWTQLHSELTEAMQEYGLSPAEAAQVAAEELNSQQAPPSGDLDFDDPDLAPLAREIAALRAQQSQSDARLSQWEQERAYQAQVAEAEAQQAQYIAHMHGQVAEIRKANPQYTDQDLQTLIQLGSFYNDDLGQAQAALESYVADRMTRYFEKKQGGASPALQPQSGAGVLSSQETAPQSLREAEAEAIEYIRALQAQGELDT